MAEACEPGSDASTVGTAGSRIFGVSFYTNDSPGTKELPLQDSLVPLDPLSFPQLGPSLKQISQAPLLRVWRLHAHTGAPGRDPGSRNPGLNNGLGVNGIYRIALIMGIPSRSASRLGGLTVPGLSVVFSWE